jgi:hypothetical protein
MIGETREAIEAYCVAVGLVVYEWNDLHEKLARLFALVREADRQETLTEWYAIQSDTRQREKLRFAVTETTSDRWKKSPRAPAVRLFGGRLKVSGDHELPGIGCGNGVVENACFAACPQSAPSRIRGGRPGIAPGALEPADLRVRQMQLPMMGRPEDVDVEIEGRRRDIGAAMRVVRGIALRRPIALAGLPDDMIVGDPSGFDVGAVEKDSQPLAAFANRCAHVSSSNSLAISALLKHSGELEAVMQITPAAADGVLRHDLNRPGLKSAIDGGATNSRKPEPREADQRQSPGGGLGNAARQGAVRQPFEMIEARILAGERKCRIDERIGGAAVLGRIERSVRIRQVTVRGCHLANHIERVRQKVDRLAWEGRFGNSLHPRVPNLRAYCKDRCKQKEGRTQHRCP